MLLVHRAQNNAKLFNAEIFNLLDDMVFWYLDLVTPTYRQAGSTFKATIKSLALDLLNSTDNFMYYLDDSNIRPRRISASVISSSTFLQLFQLAYSSTVSRFGLLRTAARSFEYLSTPFPISLILVWKHDLRRQKAIHQLRDCPFCLDHMEFDERGWPHCLSCDAIFPPPASAFLEQMRKQQGIELRTCASYCEKSELMMMSRPEIELELTPSLREIIRCGPARVPPTATPEHCLSGHKTDL